MPISRSFALALLAAFVLFAAGCGSNNKGKIVGKWLLYTNVTPNSENDVTEFTADGQFSVTNGPNVLRGRYRLGAGDKVTLYDLDPLVDGKTTAQVTVRPLLRC